MIALYCILQLTLKSDQNFFQYYTDNEKGTRMNFFIRDTVHNARKVLESTYPSNLPCTDS